MAHASVRERGILQMKKVRKARAKKKFENAKKQQEMGTESYKAYVLEKSQRSLKSKVQTALWDYEHNQYPINKQKLLKSLLEERKEQIIKTQEANCEKELEKIEGILNGLFS